MISLREASEVSADGTSRITWHGKDFAANSEIVKLGDVEIIARVPDLPDAGLRQMIAALVACERVEAANRIAPAHFLELTACLFIEKGGTFESWRAYEIELGVPKPRTKKPRSRIQPFIKWLRGGLPDNGIVTRLSGAFEAWLAEKDRPDPTRRNSGPGTSRLAEWLAENHGYQAVADAYDHRLEYEAALKRGAVWVTHANGTERVYDSKAAAESQNEGPAYEEPAEWWALLGCEPVGRGEYRRIDPQTDEEDANDPLPERIEGNARPEFCPRPDHQNYSESNSEKTAAVAHDRQRINQAAVAHSLAGSWQAASRTTVKSQLSEPRSSSNAEPAWLTPPEFLAQLDREFNFTKGFDPCPYPRPEGFDGLKVPWPVSTYCNPPFRKQHSTDGTGIAAFARKAIEENTLGKTVVLVLPTFSTINHLLEAGVELRSARRIDWIDPNTGQPATTSPSSNMLAILRGKAHSKENEIATLKARIAELEADNAALKARIEELSGAPG
jgi:hypothetical protein